MVGRYFEFKLKGKVFSLEVKRELISLNTKTLCRWPLKSSKLDPEKKYTIYMLLHIEKHPQWTRAICVENITIKN